MSGEWISGEEHMSNVLTKTAASPMTRIIVGSVFNLRNVQNKSNAEGYLKRAVMATLQEVQTDLLLPVVSNKACPHLTVEEPFQGSVINEPKSCYATSQSFGLCFFPRMLSVSFRGRVKKRCRGCSWFSSNRTTGSGTSGH